VASDSDDLEEALRENLKLRSELADEVSKAKAESQRGVAYRLGWVLYWICLTFALLAGLMSVFALSGSSEPDAIGAAFTALVLYGIGRAFRYVLSGE
jgi:hypothetical protein